MHRAVFGKDGVRIMGQLVPPPFNCSEEQWDAYERRIEFQQKARLVFTVLTVILSMVLILLLS